MGDDTTPRRARPAPHSHLRRAFVRYVAIASVMGLFLFVYQNHPYYLRMDFAPWRSVSYVLFGVWIALGFPYALASVHRFGTLKTALTDPALHYVLLARSLVRALRPRRGTTWATRTRPLRRALRARRVRTSLLALCVKGFFVPLMTIFLSGHLGSLAGMWAHGHDVPVFVVQRGSPPLAQWIHYVQTHGASYLPSADDVAPLAAPSSWTLAGVRRVTDYYYDLIFALDCAWALMGYLSESRWLGNKTRSVEPTGLGWLVALFCYPPFNEVTGTYLPLNAGAQLFATPTPALVCRVLMLMAFTVYVAATLAFGMKFSNLTNRGIVSRGPYRFMRHPAYVCKGFAWWMENLPTITPMTAFFLVLVNGVYAMRAWTEERHLSRDPEYVAYKKKVPWAILPKIY